MAETAQAQPLQQQHRHRWEDAETLEHVRPAVREVLARSEAFRRLPAAEQQQMAREMVKVASYLANPEGIVDSSIQQMHAYGDLVANVAKTVDQFAQDNITMNNSRDWLANRFSDKLVFDMRASDTAKRESKASMHDTTESKASTEMEASYDSWFSPVSGSMKASASTDHVATVESSVDDTSESKAEVKAKLTGEVRVNFKSDYFPMDKMASPEMIAAIQGNATPRTKPGTAPAAAAPAATAPPAPAPAPART